MSNLATEALTMKHYFSLIKFSHTIFALPFAMIGYFIAVLQTADGLKWHSLLLVLLCMVFARSAAMAFNRYLDRDIDQDNPRTLQREIPAGIITPQSALIFVLINALAFIVTTWFINRLCFFLSPVALLIILGYSYTKRFTALCHFVLGLGLSLAPVGAYLAVTGAFAILPIIYGFVVLSWVAGFDIIYALQDDQFDKKHQLHSVPVWLGRANALRLSEVLHLISGLGIVLAALMLGEQFPTFDWIHWVGAIIFIALLLYQHLIVKENDLSRVNLAFFTTNGIASLILGVLVIADAYF